MIMIASSTTAEIGPRPGPDYHLSTIDTFLQFSVFSSEFWFWFFGKFRRLRLISPIPEDKLRL
jgi:hypothetical protein